MSVPAIAFEPPDENGQAAGGAIDVEGGDAHASSMRTVDASHMADDV
jgi:hypothetical protein